MGHTRDWTDLRTFFAQQTAQLNRIEAHMESNQSSIQSLFKRRGGDMDDEGPVPPRTRAQHTTLIYQTTPHKSARRARLPSRRH